MAIYEYECQKCDNEYTIIKSIKEYDGKDPCPGCGNIGDRIFSPNIQFIGTKVQDAEYNPAFGQVVKNKQERDELAKRNGMVEIGNQDVGKLEKEIKEDKRKRTEREWSEL